MNEQEFRDLVRESLFCLKCRKKEICYGADLRCEDFKEKFGGE